MIAQNHSSTNDSTNKLAATKTLPTASRRTNTPTRTALVVQDTSIDKPPAVDVDGVAVVAGGGAAAVGGGAAVVFLLWLLVVVLLLALVLL